MKSGRARIEKGIHLPTSIFHPPSSTTDLTERKLYRHDLAPVPGWLSQKVFRTLPDVVVRPSTSEEVAAVIRYAHEQRLPVTPRAAASTAYYNTVPAQGGILLDLNGLRGLVSFDRESETVAVLPATRWLELDQELRYSHGYAVKTYPTSAPGATVGGWFNMMGLGVGSLKHGLLADLVTCADVVLPNGQVVTLTRDSDPPLSWFAGSEGTLGVVTRLELSVRPMPQAEGHHLIAFRDLNALQRASLALIGTSPTPYNLHFAHATFYQVLAKAGFNSQPSNHNPKSETCAEPSRSIRNPKWAHTLRVDYAGDRDEVMAGAEAVSRLAAAHGGEMLAPALAEEDWADRFSDLRAKRAGPTLLGAELLLPNDRLAAFATEVERLGRRLGLPIYTYATLARKVGDVTSFFPADERQTLSYLLDLSLTRQIMIIGLRLGGRPYGLGAWNTPYLGAYPPAELAEWRCRKQRLDPLGIMNPGKVYHAPARLPGPLFNLGLAGLFLFRRVVPRR
ncbi:MAG: FAD-binding oxidoreductase [Anaerolineae bacterium]